MIAKYLAEIEELRTKLCESENFCEQLRYRGHNVLHIVFFLLRTAQLIFFLILRLFRKNFRKVFPNVAKKFSFQETFVQRITSLTLLKYFQVSFFTHFSEQVIQKVVGFEPG